MRRQLRANGGITNVTPRKKFGLGSSIKDRFRKLIPNEIANVAVKAAPIVAPFNPGVAALMRGIGRFDQRGSISDALKQGAATYAFGAGVGKLGGAQSGDGFFGGQTYSKAGFGEGPIGRLFDRQAAINTEFKGKPNMREVSGETGFIENLKTGAKKIIKKLPKGVAAQLTAGTVTAGASLLASYFQGDFREQEPGETMEDYLAARKVAVGEQMRTYMDNYFASDPEYSALDDAGKDAFVARYNVAQGGRVGYAMGSPHGQEMPTFSEGVPQMFMSDELGALPKAEGGVSPEDMGILSVDDFDNVENYRRYINKLKENQDIPLKFKPDEPLMDETGSVSIKQLEILIQKGADNKLIQRMTGTPIPIIERIRRKISKAQDGVLTGLFPTMRRPSLKTILEKDKKAQDGVLTGLFPTMRRPSLKTILEKNKKAKGGRIKKYGGGVTAAMPKIPTGTPRVNAGGISELDYRAKGGFVPVGIKEKADDVPAMLSKNEFVMTANAVRGAGNGSIEKGAQRMYDTMKKLEKRKA
jgi:hypothetical protein